MKKLLSLILGVCLIIPCAFLFTGCKDKPEAKMETWDGTTLEVSVADADSNNVITIDTAEELAGFAKAVNAGETFEEYTIRLACDMDMANKTWTPIGVGHRSKTATPFAGTFDGNGKKIIGLNNGDFVPNESYIARESDLIDEVYTYHYGFFGYVTGATIKNLELTVNFNCDSANLKGDSVGGLVGFSSGKLTVENCVVNGTIDGGFDSVGGLVGRAYDSTSTNQVVIKNCINNANITTAYKGAGILGYVYSQEMNFTVEGCVNNGEITSKGTKIDKSKASRYTSIVSGVVVYGLKNNANHSILIIKNINNGTLNVADYLVDEATREQLHHYSYIATRVGQTFNAEKHLYDFGVDKDGDTERENKNFGKVYFLNEEVNANLVSLFETNEYNGTTNIPSVA